MKNATTLANWPTERAPTTYGMTLQFRCAKCHSMDEEPVLCCERFMEPANEGTRESWTRGEIDQASDLALDLTVALRAASACACDCRRRRVMLRAVDYLMGCIAVKVAGIPRATTDQELTIEEMGAVREAAPHFVSMGHTWAEPFGMMGGLFGGKHDSPEEEAA